VLAHQTTQSHRSSRGAAILYAQSRRIAGMVNNHLRFEPECSARGVNLFHNADYAKCELTLRSAHSMRVGASQISVAKATVYVMIKIGINFGPNQEH
jgi:hypothetical protein